MEAIMNDKIYQKSILAGILIGIGVIINAMAGVPIAGALFFSFGLVAICHYGLFLYTGKIGNPGSLRSELPTIFIWNIVGILIVTGIFIIANPAAVGIFSTIAAVKFKKTILQFFLMGVLCGGLVHIGVKADNYLITIAAVAIFILIGAEHCIALWPFVLVDFTVMKFIKFIAVIIGNSIGAIATQYLLYGEFDKCE